MSIQLLPSSVPETSPYFIIGNFEKGDENYLKFYEITKKFLIGKAFSFKAAKCRDYWEFKVKKFVRTEKAAEHLLNKYGDKLGSRSTKDGYVFFAKA